MERDSTRPNTLSSDLTDELGRAKRVEDGRE
jgi:hypothetical protein